jgi:ring-1,2-phenylacetyl-CoA epoxidase subunit PaaD
VTGLPSPTVSEAAPRAWLLLAGVPDPEIPVVSVVDLGIVRDVEESADGRAVSVTLTPTYSGCPATEVIARDVRAALEASYDEVQVHTRLSPAWTTDWLSEAAREKLAAFGIAPPGRSGIVLVAGPAIGLRADDLHDSNEGRPTGTASTTGTAPTTGAAEAVDREGRPAACPHCGGSDLAELAHFGSTPCKALWRCTTCREPFDYMKRH